MADFNKRSAADMAADRADIDTGTTGKHEVSWGTEDAYWRESYAARPYAKADRNYEYYQPAYRYGTESAARHAGHEWNDVEHDLRSGWDRARGASHSAWDDVKDAVRDAWDRVRGRR